jgi:hypothetical protein
MNDVSLIKLCFGMLATLGAFSACEAGQGIVGAGPSGVCRSTGGSSGNFLPGKFWEEEAGFRQERQDTSGALEAFKRAAYYGDKDAQYDVAMTYLKGARKVPVDVPLGVAWLRIAAQYGQSLSDEALRKLEPALTPQQRAASARDFENLVTTYGVSTTRSRVMKTYQLERGRTVFADWVCHDGLATAADAYLITIDREFADYVSTMYGNVIVEPLQPLPGPQAKK